MDYQSEIRIPYSQLHTDLCSQIEKAIYDKVSEGFYYRVHKRLSLFIITPYNTKDVSCYELMSYIKDNINVDFSGAFRYQGVVYNVVGQIIPYPSYQELMIVFNILR